MNLSDIRESNSEDRYFKEAFFISFTWRKTAVFGLFDLFHMSLGLVLYLVDLWSR